MTQNPAFVAGANIEPSRFLKAGSDPYTAIKATDGSAPILGVSHEGTREAPIPGVTPMTALTGEALRVYGIGDVCEVEAGATVTAGQYVMPNGDARAIPATAGNHTGGRALNDAVNLGRLRIQVLQGYVET